jgi:hypothetical protein
MIGAAAGSLAIFAVIRRALALLLVGLRRQTPNNYGQGEHKSPRNRMIAVKVRSQFGYMLCQKRQAAKRQ